MPDKKNSPIKVGFVGLSTQGWASNVLGPSLQDPSQRGNYSLVAVSTSSPASAAASAEKHSAIAGHLVKAYSGSTSHIAGDPNVDFVAVSVKAPNHKDALIPVIEAGKDFFVEWPAGTGLAQVKELAAKSKKHQVKSLVGLQGRQSGVVQKAKEIIDSGRIGPVRSSVVSVTLSREGGFWGPIIKEGTLYIANEKNGVTMLNVPVGHHLDSLTYVLGDFASINSTAANMYPEAVLVDDTLNPIPGKALVPQTAPDYITFSGTLRSGALSTNTWQGGALTSKGRREFTWTIVGERGTLEILSDNAYFWIYAAELFLDGQKVELDGPSEDVLTSVGRAWSAFASTRRGEPEGTFATIDDAVKNHELLDAIQRSAKEGRTLHL